MNSARSIRNIVGSKIATNTSADGFEQALEQAFQSFSREYPGWVAALFDEHFLKNAGVPILHRLLQGSMGSLAEQLAQAWVEQISVSPRVRQDLVREFKPMAARFLQAVQMAYKNSH